MCNHCLHSVVAASLLGAVACAFSLEETRTLSEEGKLDEAIARLEAEITDNPAHGAARVLLARTYEKAGKQDEALAAWREVLTLSNDEDRLHEARVAVSRLRRREVEQIAEDGIGPRTDPFKIPMPEIQWEGLEVVEDTDYLPPILPAPRNFEVPPFAYQTQHFTVYTTNERLSRVIGERAEIYLEFMLEKLFGGRSWAVRFPILVYRDVQDYQQHGGPTGTGGVTFGHVTGKTEAILLFQMQPDRQGGGSRRGGRGGGGGRGVWQYGIESVLPHELTHAVINEFFGGQEIPRWLHEAVAGRFEQTRDHYQEAARLARHVVAGEYFRMRDLFEQDSYPKRIELFYEQSAAVVLYLFEAGPEAMHVFLSELRAGNGHDAACAAALGIPKENAVEEFERRWVEWMRERYLQDLDPAADGTILSSAAASTHRLFRPWVDELDTVANLQNWRTVKLDSLNAFHGVGRAEEEWVAEGRGLRCNIPGRKDPSILGIRMNEAAPAAVRCEVKFLGNPGEVHRQFGFAQLDADGFDTRIRVLAPLPDNNVHNVVCLWLDDLVVYLDGVCVGRFPAMQIRGDARDIDYPIGLLTHGPVQVRDLEVAAITDFSERPVVAEGEQNRRGTRRRRGP